MSAGVEQVIAAAMTRVIARHERSPWHDRGCNAICSPNTGCGWTGWWDDHPRHVAEMILDEVSV